LLFTTCSVFEPDDKIDYFDVSAEGYVYDGDINNPIVDASVTVIANFKSRGDWFTKHSIYEYYRTNDNGYFNVRFIRRADHENVTHCTVSVVVDKPINNFNSVGFSYNELRKSKKNIQLGTFIYKNNRLHIEK